MIVHVRHLGMCAALVGASATAQAASFNRVTAAGHTVRIASHATWTADCSGGPALVEIVVPPQHGRAYGADAPITITRIDTGNGACRGRRIVGKVVFYQPAPGFHGQDQFAYTSTTLKGTVLPHQVTVEVR